MCLWTSIKWKHQSAFAQVPGLGWHPGHESKRLIPQFTGPAAQGPFSCGPSCLMARPRRDLVLSPGGRVQKHSVRIKEPENLPLGCDVSSTPLPTEPPLPLYLLTSSWPPPCPLRRTPRPSYHHIEQRILPGRVCGDGCMGTHAPENVCA